MTDTIPKFMALQASFARVNSTRLVLNITVVALLTISGMVSIFHPVGWLWIATLVAFGIRVLLAMILTVVDYHAAVSTLVTLDSQNDIAKLVAEKINVTIPSIQTHGTIN